LGTKKIIVHGLRVETAVVFLILGEKIAGLGPLYGPKTR
jgi:hypothetical protein